VWRGSRPRFTGEEPGQSPLPLQCARLSTVWGARTGLKPDQAPCHTEQPSDPTALWLEHTQQRCWWIPLPTHTRARP
jgi:hypothetical protein